MCSGESIDDLAIMVDVFEGEGASLAVFEPLLCWLVAADVGIPSLFGYIAEVLSRVDHDASVLKCDGIHHAFTEGALRTQAD